MTDKRTLDAVFGPAEKSRGRPAIRPEPTRPVTVKVARSIVREAHKRRLNRGLLTRYLTMCYIRLLEMAPQEVESLLERFEYNRGANIEQLTAKDLLTHARKSTTTRTARPGHIRPVVALGTGRVSPDAPQAD